MIAWIFKLWKRFAKKEHFYSSFHANLKRDSDDPRDFEILATPHKLKKYEIPNLPPIRNQSWAGSCASHAAIACYEIQLPKRQFIEGSELYHYYYARKEVNKTFPGIGGMSMRDACKTLCDYGLALEVAWPYILNNVNKEPSWTARMTSKLYKPSRYERLYSLNDIKFSIENNIPVMVGMYASQTFKNFNTVKNIYDPQTKTGVGHAVDVIGFDDDKKLFKIRNSWGKVWSKEGYFWMTYESFSLHSFDWWRVICERK